MTVLLSSWSSPPASLVLISRPCSPSFSPVLPTTCEILEELRRIIVSQKKQLDDAWLRGQQPSTPTTREGSHSEPRTGSALSALLIVDSHENTASPEHDTLSSPFRPRHLTETFCPQQHRYR